MTIRQPLARTQAPRPTLCRYCRRFVGHDGKEGICGKCWALDPSTPPANK